MVVKKHKKPITIVKKENQKPKKGVKQTFEVNKNKQEQEVLGNRAIEQRAEKKSETNQAKTLPMEKRENQPKTVKLVPVLKGDSIEVIKLFSHASASNMARLYPYMGEILNEKLKKEQKEEQQNAPVLEVKKGKKKQVNKSKIIEISKPTMAKEEKLSEKEPKVLKATEHKDKSEIPNNKASIKVLEKYSKSNFSDWFRENFSNFLESIKTEDKNISTSTGEVPVLYLREDANPNRMENEKSKALKDVTETKENLSSEILKHTGQEQIQPVELEHKSNIVLSEKTEAPLLTPSSEGMQDYVSLELPDKVRKGADALLQPTLEQSTLKLEEGSSQLSLEKEEGKAENIRQSKEEVEKLHVQANREEEQIIIQRREEIVQKQEKSLEEAYDGVSKFNESAKKEKSSYKKEIDGKVNKANSDANFKLKEGEKEAKKIQKEKEAEAKKKKRELKEKKKSQGFFSRVGSVIKSAVELITKAIDVIFDAMRSLVKAAIEKAKKLAVAVINVARAWIVEKLEAFKTWAKGMVDKYVKEYFPRVAKALNSAIDFVVDSAVKGVNAVADGLIKGVEALASALSKALDKVLATFQTGLKAAVQIAGAVLTGDFEGALKVAIQAVCDTLGIDSKPVFNFFEKAGKNMMKILKSPVIFFKNLVLAVGKGINGFKKHIVTHLKSGLFAWLTGAMSSVEINFPKKFDFKGILSLVMQVMGITYANIKAQIIKKYPPAQKAFKLVEKGVEVIKEIKVFTPMVLWKKIKEKVGNLKKMVISSIRGFVAFTLVEKGVTWLLSLLTPASAIVKVIKLLFDFVMFLVERFTQIKDFVLSVYNSITAIASGSLAKASQAVEDAMARSLPVMISLIARLAGLGGIGKSVQELIHTAGKPVKKLINFLVERAIKVIKKMFAKKKSKGRNERKKKGKIDKTLGKNLKFKAGKENHKLWITNAGGKIKVMVASRPKPLKKLLNTWGRDAKKSTSIKKIEARVKIKEAKRLLKQTYSSATDEDRLIKKILKDKKVTDSEKRANKNAGKATELKEENLVNVLQELFYLFVANKRLEVLDQYPWISKGKWRIEAKDIVLNKFEKKDIQKIYNKNDLEELKKRLKQKKLYEEMLKSKHEFDIELRGKISEGALKSIDTYKDKLSIYKWNLNKKKNNIPPTYKEEYKKEFIFNQIGAIRKIIRDKKILDNYLDKSDVQLLKEEIKKLFENRFNKKNISPHSDYKPVVKSIKKKGNKFIILYGYENDEHKKKTFKVVFDFAKIDDHNNSIHTQRTEAKNLTLKDSGTRGKTDSSGKLLNQKILYRQFLNDKKIKFKKKSDEKTLKKLVDAVVDQKGLEKHFKDKAKRENLEVLDVNLFDSAHLVADWFSGSGYKEALNLTVTSAEYNRKTMGDAEKKIESKIDKESIFNLTVSSRWDILEDNEVIDEVNTASLFEKINKNKKIKNTKNKELAKQASEELSKILLEQQNPRRVLGVSYYPQITAPKEVNSGLKEKIACDVWMSSYFDFGTKNECKE